MAVKEKEKKPLHLAKMNIKKGDTVVILVGKDRGKQGVVSRAMPQENKVIVEGLNLVKKYVRSQNRTTQGGIIEKAMPIHVSNTMLICTECGRPTRVGQDRKSTRLNSSHTEIYTLSLHDALPISEPDDPGRHYREGYAYPCLQHYADLHRVRSADTCWPRSEEHTSELQSHRDLHSFPTRRSSDLRTGRPREALSRRLCLSMSPTLC